MDVCFKYSQYVSYEFKAANKQTYYGKESVPCGYGLSAGRETEIVYLRNDPMHNKILRKWPAARPQRNSTFIR